LYGGQPDAFKNRTRRAKKVPYSSNPGHIISLNVGAFTASARFRSFGTETKKDKLAKREFANKS
jgi:hypothetical protein